MPTGPFDIKLVGEISKSRAAELMSLATRDVGDHLGPTAVRAAVALLAPLAMTLGTYWVSNSGILAVIVALFSLAFVILYRVCEVDRHARIFGAFLGDYAAESHQAQIEATSLLAEKAGDD